MQIENKWFTGPLTRQDLIVVSCKHEKCISSCGIQDCISMAYYLGPAWLEQLIFTYILLFQIVIPTDDLYSCGLEMNKSSYGDKEGTWIHSHQRTGGSQSFLNCLQKN